MSMKSRKAGLKELLGSKPSRADDALIKKVDTEKMLREMADQLGVNYVENSLVRVRPSVAKPWSFANRSSFDESFIKELAEEFLQHGQSVPALGVMLKQPTATGETFLVIAGQTRWRAAMRAFEQNEEFRLELRLLVDPTEERNRYEIDANGDLIPLREDRSDIRSLLRHQRAENEKRREICAIDEALFHRRLLDDEFGTQKALSENLEIPKSTLSHQMKIAEAFEDDVLALLVSREQIGIKLARKFANQWLSATRKSRTRALKETSSASVSSPEAVLKRLMKNVATPVPASSGQPRPALSVTLPRGDRSYTVRLRSTPKGTTMVLDGLELETTEPEKLKSAAEAFLDRILNISDHQDEP